jgi:midasin
MLLAERTRRAEDKAVVKEVLESEMGVKINEDSLYDLQRIDVDSFLGCSVPRFANVVWTKALQRLYTLVCRALKSQEPVLLVGETGTGKTSICQIFAEGSSQSLLTLNCHQNLETADIIGGMRPVRNRSALQADAIRNATLVLKDIGIEPSESDEEHLISILYSALKSNGHHPDDQLRHRLQEAYERLSRSNSIFEWHDGPLIDAMRTGGVFLMDEISLADDSILERLNSVLEHGRYIVLAERGGADSDNTTIQADERFRLVATMNPGGDYGKKELSPALRNRFTEIWVPPIDDRQDLELIVNSCWAHPSLRMYTTPLLGFVDWLCIRVGDHSLLSLRDILVSA